MRYRQLSPTGDYTIGLPFLQNSPACVAQAVETRLRLWLGEWFVDTTDGTPWLTQILGPQAGKNPDAAITARILGTPGVTAVTKYGSTYNGRTLTVNATIDTLYGEATISVSLTNGAPSASGAVSA